MPGNFRVCSGIEKPVHTPEVQSVSSVIPEVVVPEMPATPGYGPEGRTISNACTSHGEASEAKEPVARALLNHLRAVHKALGSAAHEYLQRL